MLYSEGFEGKAAELKRALLQAYRSEERKPAAKDVLVELAGKVGLVGARAKVILAGKFGPKDTIAVDAKGGVFSFEIEWPLA